MISARCNVPTSHSQEAVFNLARTSLKICTTAAACMLLFADFARAQNSQFLFDANGNLLVQTAKVIAPPQILGQPQNVIAVPGEAASLFVVAANTRSLAYQWRFNGANISGATNDALLQLNVSTNNEGEYRVVLTNPSGSVTSAPALLMIDSDADGVADSWETNFFGNLNQNAVADLDGDGVSNLQEFLDGTSPTNKASALYRITLFTDGGSVVKIPDAAAYTNGQLVTLTATPSSSELFHAWTGDVLTRSNSISLVMTNNKTAFAHFGPMLFTWTNRAGGDWNIATNWAPNLVPGTNDSVFIANAGTITLDTPAECAEVTLGVPNGSANSPAVTGTGTLTVRDTFRWMSGTMSGGGTTVIKAGATLDIANDFTVVLNSRPLDNSGTVFWEGTGVLLLNNSSITNRPGALFHAQNAATISVQSGALLFENAGTFRKSGGTTAVPTGLAFNNSGAVEIQSGTLRLSGGGAHSGSFAVAGSSALILVGTHTADANSSFTGSGGLTISGGTADLAGLVNVSGSNTFSGGTANFTGIYVCTNNTLTISGGTANLNGTGLVSPAVVHLTGGALGGSQNVTVGSAMTWTAGTMSGAGRTVIAPAAMLKVSSTTAVNLRRSLENGGTVLWTNTGPFVLIDGVISNRPGALFHAQNAAAISQSGGANRFDNAGVFRKSISTGNTTIASGVSFNNSGAVEIQSGTLVANGGYVSSSNALLNCALGGTTPGTNYGQLKVAGTVNVNGALSVDFINGFLPTTNDAFTLLTAGTRNGAFANFIYPSNAVTMQLTNMPNSVVARVANLATTNVVEPVLLPPELSGSDIKLIWTAVSNTVYRVEFKTDLSLSNWNILTGDVTSLSNTAGKVDVLTPGNRFYRVRVLP